MNNKLEISPSILSANLGQLQAEIEACERGGADRIHIDVMDGSFVPNITFGQVMVKNCRALTDLPLDVHLMIVSPERHIESFAKAGADIITVHYETCPLIQRTLTQIRETGAKSGICFNPGTPLDSLRYLSADFDQVLLMTVNPGFGGQKYIPSMTLKISDTAQILKELGSDALIQVDGGIDATTIGEAYAAGARNFIAGSSVFGHPEGTEAGIRALRAGVENRN